MKTGLCVVQLPQVGSLERPHNPMVAGSNPAPATITTCSERSPVSGDLFAFWAAPSIAARFPFNFDSERALLRCQGDGVNEVSECLSGFRAVFWLLEGLSQCGDLLP